MRSKVARAIRCSVVDIKRTVDMFLLKRIRLRSHAVIGLKAKGSMRARERREHVGIAQISGSKKSIFVLSLVLPLEGPRKPSLRWARCLTTGSVYFIFHCNNQLLLHFSTRRWELRLDIAPERGLRGGLELRSSIVRWRVWFLAEIPLVQYPGYCRKSRV